LAEIIGETKTALIPRRRMRGSGSPASAAGLEVWGMALLQTAAVRVRPLLSSRVSHTAL